MTEGPPRHVEPSKPPPPLPATDGPTLGPAPTPAHKLANAAFAALCEVWYAADRGQCHHARPTAGELAELRAVAERLAALAGPLRRRWR